jgi:hypothetical protein
MYKNHAVLIKLNYINHDKHETPAKPVPHHHPE